MPYHDKNSLGQNFIKYPSLVRELLLASNIKGDDTVLEIGSGKGVITKELTKVAKKVIAIEKDSSLITNYELRITNLKVVNQDFLEFELPTEKYKVFSNIPFSITSEIMDRFWSTSRQPEEMYLIMQKEAAEKFAYKGQSAVIYYPWYEVEILGDIDRTNFTLKPQVKIDFIKFKKREKPFVTDEDKTSYKKFVIYNFNYFLKCFTFAQRKRIEGMYKITNKKPTEIPLDLWPTLYKNFKKIASEKGKKLLEQKQL